MNYFKLLSFEQFNKIKIQNKLLLENSSSSYEYGCIMLFFEIPEIKNIQSKIDNNDIYYEYGDKTYGLEDEPHVTLLYGIYSQYILDNYINKILNELKNEVGEIKLKDISLFENEKYDVLKLNAEGDFLHKINQELRNKLPHINKYPEYKPHLTIAYLKPNTGQKYLKLFKNIEINSYPISLVYNKPNNERILIEI